MWLTALALTAILVTGSSGAQGAEGGLPPTRLRYERQPGAESCPDEAQLRESIATRLGSDPFSDEGRRVLEIRVGAQGEWLEARIRLVGETGAASGQRDLRSRSHECRDLATVLVLTASMVLDPLTAPVLDTTLAPPTAAEEEPSAHEPETSAAITASGERRGSGPGLEVGVALVGEVGFVSSPSAGLALQVGIAWPLFSLSLEGQANLPVYQQLSTGGSVSSSQITGSLVPCFTPWHLGLCGLFSAGATRVTATGISPEGSDSESFFGLGARVYLGLRLLDWLEARPQLDLLVPLTQTTIVVNGSTEWTSSPVTGSAALAFVVRFR